MNQEIFNLVKDYKETKSEEVLLDLWGRFQPLVISSIYKFSIPPRYRDDCSQECFIKFHEALNKFDLGKKVPFESFLKMSLSYFLLNRVRKKSEVLTLDNNWQTGQSPLDFEENKDLKPEESLEVREKKEKINKAMEELTKKQEIAVKMYYMEGMTIKEIGERLGCSYGVARKHKDTGMKKLRKSYKG